MVTLSYLISGRVQGVGYRHHARRMAEAFDIRGWIRNLPDGRVEIVATGAEENLRSFREQIELGPRGARVDRVDVQEKELERHVSFTIRS